MKNLLILLVLTLLTGIFAYYYERNFTNISVEFKKLRPVNGKVNVYYNGYKIGRSKKTFPCPNSSGVCVDISLNKKSMFLPDNITAKMKQKRIHSRKYEDYIEIIYPENPSFKEVQKDAVIKGELSAGYQNYMNEEVSYSDMDSIKTSLINTTQNLEKTTSILFDILYSVNDMVKNSEKNVSDASKNMNSSMKNINSITSKINYSIDPNNLKNILLNIDETSGNINAAAFNLKGITGSVNNYSNNITGSISQIDSITKNTDEILLGVNCALRKPFGGLRLLFGKVIK